MSARSWLLAMGVVGVALTAVSRQRKRASDVARPRAKPAPLQTWEGEGGAVPVGGEHVTAQRVAPLPSATSTEPPRQTH